MAISRRMGIFAAVCRIALGAVFIFSGFVKSIDPWGTALKIEEYFSAMGLEALDFASGAIAVCQCALELLLGLMLVFKVKPRISGGVAMAFMIFFTAFTFVIAIWNPVDDCGCFGDALKISNWATFAKNAVLLPVSVVVWRSARGERQRFSARDTLLTIIFATFAFGLNLYSWCNLPLVDTFPYKKGTNLRKDVLCTSCISRSVVLVYEDMQTGELREFGLSDTTWYDTSRWRYAATRTAYDNLSEEAQRYDFALWRNGSDVADETVYAPGLTYMITVRDGEDLSDACRKGIEKFVVLAPPDVRIIYVEGKGEELREDTEEIAGRRIPAYTADPRLLALLLRTDAGVVVITDGTVGKKYPCRRASDIWR